jgi:Mor family transcriptional regulator
MSLTQIPEDQWKEVAWRHTKGESLRQLAKVYAVSYETVRQVLKRVEVVSLISE